MTNFIPGNSDRHDGPYSTPEETGQCPHQHHHDNRSNRLRDQPKHPLTARAWMQLIVFSGAFLLMFGGLLFYKP